MKNNGIDCIYKTEQQNSIRLAVVARNGSKVDILFPQGVNKLGFQ
jgi:hypothetical protein